MSTAGAIVVAEPPSGGVVGQGALPVVVGQTVLWNWGDTGASGIHASTLAGPEVELYRAPAGTHTFSVRSDGTWIAWRAGADDPTGTTSPLNELWAAPYSDSGPLDARLLRTDLINDEFPGTIGDGMYATVGADPTGTHNSIQITSLADGSRRYYILPERDACFTGWYLDPADAAWVTRDEVALPMHYYDATDDSILHTVVRLDIRSLPVEPMPLGH